MSTGYILILRKVRNLHNPGVVQKAYAQAGAIGNGRHKGWDIGRKMNRTPKDGHERTYLSTAPNRSVERPKEPLSPGFTTPSPVHLSQRDLSTIPGLRTE